jgi:hypothetical protein
MTNFDCGGHPPEEAARYSTGLAGLDDVFQKLLPGDNVVWQVDAVEDFHAFVSPFCKAAAEQGQKLTYFRFARHAPLVRDPNAEVVELSPEDGFEAFITTIHQVIRTNGRGGYYVFDSLSELALECFSDQMVGNFFMLTCPFLLKSEAVAYFGVLRHYHSPQAAQPITETTQLLVDVYRYRDVLYIYPRKIQQDRVTPTLHLLHAWERDTFRPITNSAETAEVLTSVSGQGMQTPSYGMGVWNHAFFHAEEVWQAQLRKELPAEKTRDVFRGLLRMIITGEERLLELAERYLSPPDILGIRRRMIGTGYIGGKSAGMLVARSILLGDDPTWSERLEALDAFYIPSDVFYTYIILNDCWWIRKRQRDPEAFLDHIAEARQRILAGRFPASIMDGFERMLDYFGQSPIIVRSSSLLEDSFGNAFAGKYESVFCANSGARDERLRNLLEAIRIVYASSMSEEALRHRAERGVLDQDEQMALLVQRVSGAQYGGMFYPQVAGVGFSFNPYAWSQLIDPKSGMARLVFGLGTRAVATKDDDYTRLIALNAPHLRPETGIDEVRRYTQRLVDVLDLERQEVRSIPFEEVVAKSPGLDFEAFAARDETTGLFERDCGSESIPFRSLSLDHLLQESRLTTDLRTMLAVLERAYGQPVDIEFTVNLLGTCGYRINLLQCRPLLIRDEALLAPLPEEVPEKDMLFQGRGAVIGTSRSFPVERFIYVVPSLYSQAPLQERYSVARLIGKLNRLQSRGARVVLIGPGRWGTSTPSLGVPVCFAEISRMSVVCELVTMREGFSPDVSLGTHFLSNLVESNILYTALFPERAETLLREEFFLSRPNRLQDLLPAESRLKDVVRVIDLDGVEESVWFFADCLTHNLLCLRKVNV